MLELSHVNKTFNAGAISEVSVLKDINLSINYKDFVVVVGANGSGKSTLLNIIAGSIKIDSGKIRMHNKEIQNLAEYTRSKWIARVFQNPLAGTAPALSILDNFRLAALRTRTKMMRIGTDTAFKKQVRDRIHSLDMGLENKLDQTMGTLSGGQRQALTLLMSVMANLEILLLDEPTAALDPRSAKMVMKIAQKLIKEHDLTAILITHNLNEALHYGNRLIHLQEGKMMHDFFEAEKNKLDQAEVLAWFDYFQDEV